MANLEVFEGKVRGSELKFQRKQSKQQLTLSSAYKINAQLSTVHSKIGEQEKKLSPLSHCPEKTVRFDLFPLGSPPPHSGSAIFVFAKVKS